MTISDRFAVFVAWLKGEPVIVHYAAALAVTALAHFGIKLSPEVTMEVGTLAGAVATWAARRKVTPA